MTTRPSPTTTVMSSSFVEFKTASCLNEQWQLGNGIEEQLSLLHISASEKRRDVADLIRRLARTGLAIVASRNRRSVQVYLS